MIHYLTHRCFQQWFSWWIFLVVSINVFQLLVIGFLTQMFHLGYNLITKNLKIDALIIINQNWSMVTKEYRNMLGSLPQKKKVFFQKSMTKIVFGINILQMCVNTRLPNESYHKYVKLNNFEVFYIIFIKNITSNIIIAIYMFHLWK